MEPGALYGDATAERSRALLDAWERGLGETPGERALTLLESASSQSHPLRELSVGTRDRLLLELRRGLFGATVDAIASCEHCGAAIELAFDVDDVLLPEEDGPGSVAVATEHGELTVRLPTAADVASLPVDADAALPVLLAAIAGPRAQGLSAQEIDRIGQALAEADPQADISFEVTCPACARAASVPFDTAAFVWSEVAAWAARLLNDIHQLAVGYGWREADTLAISPLRRRFYREALGA